jgi:hypothetical protein
MPGEAPETLMAVVKGPSTVIAKVCPIQIFRAAFGAEQFEETSLAFLFRIRQIVTWLNS